MFCFVSRCVLLFCTVFCLFIEISYSFVIMLSLIFCLSALLTPELGLDLGLMIGPALLPELRPDFADLTVVVEPL